MMLLKIKGKVILKERITETMCTKSKSELHLLVCVCVCERERESSLDGSRTHTLMIFFCVCLIAHWMDRCVCVCVLHSYCIAFIKTSMHDFKNFLISFRSYCIVEAIRKGFLGKIYIHPKNGATGSFSRYCMCHNSFPAP